MHEIKFECEVITPMFLAGADGKTPELRAPSIKGVMRFWWRAMNGHLSIEDLRKKEAKIFGGSRENEGRSKVNIRVKYKNKKNIEIINFRVLPHSYNKKFKRFAIKPLFKFEILFQLQETKYIFEEQLKNLFILISILGGLGKRARRGFGSFTINKIDNSVFNEDINLNHLVTLLNSANTDNTHFRISQNRVKSDFNLNHFPYIKEIKIGNGNRDYNELLKKIGKASHDYNSDYTGYGGSKGRFASPIYVSVIKKDNNYLPIITILETITPNLSGTDKSQNFINEVLS